MDDILFHRWATYVYLGSVGAIVNVEVISHSLFLKILATLLAVFAVIYDMQHDVIVLVYISKTLFGDFLANKIDTGFLKCVMGCLFFLGGVLFTANGTIEVVGWRFSILTSSSHMYILAMHTLFQFVCEFGDGQLVNKSHYDISLI